MQNPFVHPEFPMSWHTYPSMPVSACLLLQKAKLTITFPNEVQNWQMGAHQGRTLGAHIWARTLGSHIWTAHLLCTFGPLCFRSWRIAFLSGCRTEPRIGECFLRKPFSYTKAVCPSRLCSASSIRIGFKETLFLYQGRLSIQTLHCIVYTNWVVDFNETIFLHIDDCFLSGR